MRSFLTLFLLLAVFIVVSAADDVNENNGGRNAQPVGPTEDSRMILLNWDVKLNAPIPDECFSATSLQVVLERFGQDLLDNFLAGLAKQIPGFEGLKLNSGVPKNTMIRMQPTSKTTLRAQSFFDSKQGTNGYLGYKAFVDNTTPASLATMLTSITPLTFTLKDGSTVTPTWNSVYHVTSNILPATCRNGEIDNDESDIDVGGTGLCPRAWPGSICQVDDDCVEYSVCEDSATENVKVCSTFSATTPMRSYELERTSNSATTASAIIFIAFCLFAILF